MLPKQEWEHINVWGCPYTMTFDNALVSQIVIKTYVKYYRCLRAWMKNLSFKGENGEWSKLNGGFWGNGSLLDVSTNPNGQFTVNNLLYITEDYYESERTATKAAMRYNNLIFKGICDEVFADG